jgi:glycopeptide antibiotics resistance protein
LPLGFLLKNLNKSVAFLSALLLVIGIELLQYITARGIFDICDILTDTIAIIISYFWFHNQEKRCKA